MNIVTGLPVNWIYESNDFDPNLKTLQINVLSREPKQQELGGLHGYRALQNMQKKILDEIFDKNTLNLYLIRPLLNCFMRFNLLAFAKDK